MDPRPLTSQQDQHTVVVPRNLVVAMDDSELARMGLVVARSVAAPFKASVHRVKVSVTKPSSLSDARAIHEDALSLMGHVQTPSWAKSTWSARRRPVTSPTEQDVVGLVDDAGDVDAILSARTVVDGLRTYVAKKRDPMICLAARARSGLHRQLLGSTTESLLERAPCPVLAVGPQLDRSQAAYPARSILLAAGSMLPPGTLPLVAAWSQATGAEITAVRVAPPMSSLERMLAGQTRTDGELDELVATLLGMGVEATARTLHGTNPASALLTFADELEEPVLIAAPVGERIGREPTNVTRQLLQRSRWPVLASVGTPS